MSDIIRVSDINGWWNKLNEIRTRLGQSTIPYTERNVGDVILNEDIQPLKDEFTSMQTDTYYKFATYVDIGDVSVGAVCELLTKTNVNTTLNSIDTTIKCRNTATYNDGYESYENHSNGIYSNGDQSNGSKSNGTESNGTRNNGSESNGNHTFQANSYGGRSDGERTNGTKSNGNFSNGDRSNGTEYNGDESDGTESNGDRSNGTKTNGFNSNGSCVDVENINSVRK